MFESVTKYTDYEAITASDSTDLTAKEFRGLYVGAGGDVVLTTREGNDVTFKSVPAGTILPVSFSKVKATGTSASSVVGLK